MTLDSKPRRGGRRARVNMSQDQEWELITMYGTTDLSLGQIAGQFGVSGTYPYRIFEKNGFTWRRGNPLTFEEWMRENMPDSIDLRLQLQPVEDIDDDPGVEEITIDLAGSDNAINLDRPFAVVELNETEYLVEIHEFMVIASASMEGALSKARHMRPDARIKSVRENIV